MAITFNPSTAAHEAAHAVVGWCTGHPVHKIRIYNEDKRAPDGKLMKGGLWFATEGPMVNAATHPQRLVQLRTLAMVGTAGVLAQAAYHHTTLEKVEHHGHDDLDRVYEGAALLFGKNERAKAMFIVESQELAKALLRSPPGRAALAEIVHKLVTDGRCGGVFVDEVCTKYFARRMPNADDLTAHGLPSVEAYSLGILTIGGIVPPHIGKNIYESEIDDPERYDGRHRHPRPAPGSFAAKLREAEMALLHMMKKPSQLNRSLLRSAIERLGEADDATAEETTRATAFVERVAELFA